MAFAVAGHRSSADHWSATTEQHHHSAKMLTRVSPSDYETLLETVARWLPRSMTVYHWLKITHEGLAPPLDGAECYVDQWPSPTQVCALDPVIYEGMPACFLSFAQADEDDTASLAEFVASVDAALNLCQEVNAICGLSLSTPLADIQLEHFRRRGCLTRAMPNNAYWVPYEEHRALSMRHIQPPRGFYFDTLRMDEAEYVDKTWPHRWVGSLQYNQRKLRHMPNVCARCESTDQLTSFEIMHSEFGLLNHLYTKPQFRRRGLARAVEMRQMQNALDVGLIPYKIVVCENEPPMRMTSQIGFWQFYGEYPFVEIVTPKALALIDKSLQ